MKFIIATIYVLICASCFGQIDSSKLEDLLRRNQRPVIVDPTAANRTVFQLCVHIVGDNNGSGAISEAVIKRGIDTLNRDYADLGIAFRMSKINFINEDRYFAFCDIDDGYDKSSLKEMVSLTKIENMFNIYFFPNFRNSHSNYPEAELLLRGVLYISDTLMKIKKDNLTHEMGHSFGLGHSDDPNNFMCQSRRSGSSFNNEQVTEILYTKQTVFNGFLRYGTFHNINNVNRLFDPWLTYSSKIFLDTLPHWRSSPYNILKGDFNGDNSDDIIIVDKDVMYIAYGRQSGFLLQAQPFQYRYVNYANEEAKLPDYPNLVSSSSAKKGDLLSFFVGAVFKRTFETNGKFSYPELLKPLYEFTSDSGFRASKHIRLAGNIDGVNGDDIIGIGDSLVGVARRQSNGKYSLPVHSLRDKFSYSAGWLTNKHPRLLGDVDGDRKMDIVGIWADSVLVARGKADGTFKDPVTSLRNQLGNNSGWFMEKHPRMIGDVNGDGRADIIGFGRKDVYVARGKTDGTFTDSYIALSNNFSEGKGWSPDKHVRLVGDVNGDGMTDIVGFGDDFVSIALGNRQGKFDWPQDVYYEHFTFNKGWEVLKHPRLLFDIDGDGMDDIIGIHDKYVYILKGSTKFH